MTSLGVGVVASSLWQLASACYPGIGRRNRLDHKGVEVRLKFTLVLELYSLWKCVSRV